MPVPAVDAVVVITPAGSAASAPVDEYITPTPAAHAVYAASAPGARPTVSYGALAPVEEYTAPSPDGYAASAPVVEDITPSPEVSSVTPAPVDEYMAPAYLHKLLSTLPWRQSWAQHQYQR